MEQLTLTESLNEIQKAGRMFKAFERVEQVLVTLAGVEQNARELESAVAKLRVEQAEAEKSLALTREIDARTAADTIAQRDAMLEEATAEAREVVLAAEARAKEATDAARDEVGVAVEAAASLRKLADELDAENDAKLQALVEIETRIAAANEQIDKLLRAGR